MYYLIAGIILLLIVIFEPFISGLIEEYKLGKKIQQMEKYNRSQDREYDNAGETTTHPKDNYLKVK